MIPPVPARRRFSFAGAASALLAVMTAVGAASLPAVAAQNIAIAPPTIVAPADGSSLYAGPVRFEGVGIPGRTVSVAAGPAGLLNVETGAGVNPLPGEEDAEGVFVFSDEVVVSAAGRWAVDVVIAPGEYSAGAVQMELDTSGELVDVSAVSPAISFAVRNETTPALQRLELSAPIITTPAGGAHVPPASEVEIAGRAEPGALVFLTAASVGAFDEALASQERRAGEYFEAIERSVVEDRPFPMAPNGLIRVDATGEWTTTWSTPEQVGDYRVAASQVLASVNDGRYGTSPVSEPVPLRVGMDGPVSPSPEPEPQETEPAAPAENPADDRFGELETTGVDALPAAISAAALIMIGAAVLIARRRSSRSVL